MCSACSQQLILTRETPTFRGAGGEPSADPALELALDLEGISTDARTGPRDAGLRGFGGSIQRMRCFFPGIFLGSGFRV